MGGGEGGKLLKDISPLGFDGGIRYNLHELMWNTYIATTSAATLSTMFRLLSTSVRAFRTLEKRGRDIGIRVQGMERINVYRRSRV